MNELLNNKGDKTMYGSKEATAVLKAMENNSIENSGKMMVFNGPSGKYQAVTGRVRVDGSITGVVNKFDAEGNTKLAGSFKILSDGYISRWTGVPTKVSTKITKDVLKELVTPVVEEVIEEQTVTDEEAA